MPRMLSATASSHTDELIELRMQAGYYRAQHARAVARETHLVVLLDLPDASEVRHRSEKVAQRVLRFVRARRREAARRH
jgi:hypothetical protein